MRASLGTALLSISTIIELQAMEWSKVDLSSFDMLTARAVGSHESAIPLSTMAGRTDRLFTVIYRTTSTFVEYMTEDHPVEEISSLT